ncbi:hypothetical protein Tco_1121305 [Tanacetum coccineum]|uniref:Uncharacterized protein n=1 Tax=Tanacetum coccineum TaxID=301880 RepID=A0ABQ5IXA7_9ASTR
MNFCYEARAGNYGSYKWESAHDVYYKHRIIAVTKLQIVEWHGYKHLDWITVRCLPRIIGHVIQRRVEDLQLGVESYQKKLNITKPDTYRSDLKCRDAYTAYQNKDKKNKLMCIDELRKFSDGTLDDVGTALNDRLKGIRMEYLPQTIWRQSDRERAKAMIQAIDKQLKSRRIMRSLERFVGGRPQNRRDLPRDIPLDTIEVLSYDTKGVKVRKGKMQTKTELTLEQTQQGVSNEVLVSIKGVEELKRNVKIRVKRKKLSLHLGRNRVNTYAIRNTKLLFGIEDSHHGPSDAMHNPSQPLKVSQKTLVSFLTEIKHISIDFLTPS